MRVRVSLARTWVGVSGLPKTAAFMEIVRVLVRTNRRVLNFAWTLFTLRTGILGNVRWTR